MPKSGAERSKVYRVKKRMEVAPGVKKEKRPPKTSAERAREYRARKKALKDAMSKFDLALSVESDFGLPTNNKCASFIPGTNSTWNNEYSYGPQHLNLKDTTPATVPPTTAIPAEFQRQCDPTFELKQSLSVTSPASTPPPTQPQYDFVEESQSISLRNYSAPQDDYEIFGAFIASELRGLGNNFSLVRSVKKKIQLTILEAYETFEAQRSRKRPSTQKEDANLQQPHQLPPRREDPKVKIECTDDDDRHPNRLAPAYQGPHHQGELNSALK